MPARERHTDRATRIARHDVVQIGTEIRAARMAAGLSQRLVGRTSGMSYSQVGRIERATLRSVSVLQLARIGGAVGLDIRVRAYPGISPIRDAAHVDLLARFRLRLHPDLRLRLEVPIQIEDDQRAWDSVVAGLTGGPGMAIPAEAETRLYDIQGQVRRIQLKRRDAGVEHVLLIVAGTHANRRIVREAWPILRDLFPVSGRRALAALGDGRHPQGSALIFL
jgi:transcriptional regulator with XRE-family HTH domain